MGKANYKKEFDKIWKMAVAERGEYIKGPGTAFSFFDKIRKSKVEKFAVLFLDGSHRVMKTKIITTGIVNKTLVHPREVFRDAIKYNAVSIICGHNHPSGKLIPSPDDEGITERLIKAGKIIGIPLLDHLIVSDNGYYSFMEDSDIFK